jgi:hypothetical protein
MMMSGFARRVLTGIRTTGVQNIYDLEYRRFVEPYRTFAVAAALTTSWRQITVASGNSMGRG